MQHIRGKHVRGKAMLNARKTFYFTNKPDARQTIISHHCSAGRASTFPIATPMRVLSSSAGDGPASRTILACDARRGPAKSCQTPPERSGDPRASDFRPLLFALR